MPRNWPSAFERFESALDELFDDILIDRWRRRPPVGFASEAAIIEHADEYEVQIVTGDLDPQTLDVEVTENRLWVRAAGPDGKPLERSFLFAEPVDRDSVAARWSDRKLLITLPKKASRDR